MGAAKGERLNGANPSYSVQTEMEKPDPAIPLVRRQVEVSKGRGLCYTYSIRQGVKSVMGGKLLEYEAKTIRNEGRREGITEGRREGRREGITEGRMEMLMELVEAGLLPLSEAARQARLSEEAFEKRMRE